MVLMLFDVENRKHFPQNCWSLWSWHIFILISLMRLSCLVI